VGRTRVGDDRWVSDLCRCDASRLDALRSWAWDRGRTDVVLVLDLHSRARALLEQQTRHRAIRLAEMLPGGGSPADLGAYLDAWAVTGRIPADHPRLVRMLSRWLEQLCLAVDEGLGEMAAHDQEPVGDTPSPVVASTTPAPHATRIPAR
jgi:hypothetical protein